MAHDRCDRPMRAAKPAALSNAPLVEQIPLDGRAFGRSIRAAALMGGMCVNGATPIPARRPDAASIRSRDGASLARRPIRATRSETLLNHRPLTTPVPLHARWGLSRPSSHQSRIFLRVGKVANNRVRFFRQFRCVCSYLSAPRHYRRGMVYRGFEKVLTRRICVCHDSRN